MLRLARPDDKDLVRPVMARFHEASPYHFMEVDWNKIDQLVDVFTSDLETKCFILDVTEDGQVKGLLVGQVSEGLLNTENIASEVLWWVETPYRKTRTAFELLGAFEFWASKVGCKYIQMSRLEDETGEKVSKLYTKRNYRRTESAYLKEI